MSATPVEAGLPARVKAVYALGDHSMNIQLAAVSLFYLLPTADC
jgi:hypothetical protein